MDTALVLHCTLILEPTKYWKVQQLTYSGYKDLQHHWLTTDRFLKKISDTISTTTAGLPLFFPASAVSSNYNNYPFS